MYFERKKDSYEFHDIIFIRITFTTNCRIILVNALPERVEWHNNIPSTLNFGKISWPYIQF